MGQEIHTQFYQPSDFQRFKQELAIETKLLQQLITQGACSERNPVAGFEVEAWLLDDTMRPAPCNEAYLSSFNNPLAGAELAKFNIELNTLPVSLVGDVFSQLHQGLLKTWEQAEQHAQNMKLHLMMIGTVPILRQDDFHLGTMSNMNRYRALNEQAFKTRKKPIHVDIQGHEHLKIDHHDVMLEAATTSFQLHLQSPLSLAGHYYNASILASAPMVALCANSPFMFGKDLWHESRIPMFEQAIGLGGLGGAAQGPLWRVSFGSDFVRHSIFECFAENLAHFPVLLPEYFDSADSESFQHLRLHNGTIWRWNRPLIGFDDDNTPHIRIEQRTPSAGPTVIDMIANAAFFYGLCQNLCDDLQTHAELLSFPQAKDNFYQAARHGLEAHIIWFDGSKQRLSSLFKNELLPRAALGLKALHINPADIDLYLDIIRQRLVHAQNGSTWQRHFIQKNPGEFVAMTRCYLDNQRRNQPVGEWEIP